MPADEEMKDLRAEIAQMKEHMKSEFCNLFYIFLSSCTHDMDWKKNSNVCFEFTQVRDTDHFFMSEERGSLVSSGVLTVNHKFMSLP